MAYGEVVHTIDQELRGVDPTLAQVLAKLEIVEAQNARILALFEEFEPLIRHYLTTGPLAWFARRNGLA